MRRLYWIYRCWMGRPVCDRDGWFAVCKHCHRQSEVHF